MHAAEQLPRERSAPSEHARALVRGAVDYHVHVAPDFVARRITDIELARRCLETGQAGFGLKSHYSSTAERAQVVAAAVPGVVVLGTITLNRSVGGLNPLAVEVAARQGARIVWFPTVSAVNEQHEVLKAGAHEKVPVWVAFELSLREAGLACDPVPVVDDRGALLPEAHEVLDVDRAQRPRPLHRSSRPRRDLPARRGRGGTGHPRHRRDAPRVPLAVDRPGTTRSSSPPWVRSMERAFTTPHTGQGRVGPRLRGHPRRRPASARSGRRISARTRQSARRGRARADGRRVSRRRLHRRGDPHDGGREHAARRGHRAADRDQSAAAPGSRRDGARLRPRAPRPGRAPHAGSAGQRRLLRRRPRHGRGRARRATPSSCARGATTSARRSS